MTTVFLLMIGFTDVCMAATTQKTKLYSSSLVHESSKPKNYISVIWKVLNTTGALKFALPLEKNQTHDWCEVCPWQFVDWYEIKVITLVKRHKQLYIFLYSVFLHQTLPELYVQYAVFCCGKSVKGSNERRVGNFQEAKCVWSWKMTIWPYKRLCCRSLRLLGYSLWAFSKPEPC